MKVASQLSCDERRLGLRPTLGSKDNRTAPFGESRGINDGVQIVTEVDLFESFDDQGHIAPRIIDADGDFTVEDLLDELPHNFGSPAFG